MKLTSSNIIVLIIVIMTIFAAFYYTYSVVIENKTSNNPASEALAENTNSPGYTSLTGEVAKLSDYIGEIVIVNSWASWSPYSATELSDLATLISDYEDYSVNLLAINRAENPSTAERFLSTINVTDKVVLILDPDDRFYKSIGGYSMPETVIYDKSGNIIYHARGLSNIDDMRLIINNKLEQNKR